MIPTKSKTNQNKIEGTPVLKLATIKRLKINKNLQRYLSKIRQKNLSKKLSKNIRQKICQKNHAIYRISLKNVPP